MQYELENVSIRMADFFLCYLTSSSNLNLAAPFIYIRGGIQCMQEQKHGGSAMKKDLYCSNRCVCASVKLLFGLYEKIETKIKRKNHPHSNCPEL